MKSQNNSTKDLYFKGRARLNDRSPFESALNTYRSKKASSITNQSLISGGGETSMYSVPGKIMNDKEFSKFKKQSFGTNSVYFNQSYSDIKEQNDEKANRKLMKINMKRE